MPQGMSFVGRVALHERTSAGLQGIGFEVGNCPKLSIKAEPKSVERNESMTVARAPYRRMTQATMASVELVTDEFNKKNFALAARARVDEVAADAGTTLNHTFPTGVVVDSVLSVPKRNINTLVVTDSTGSPKTLTVDVNYNVDLFSGRIKILDLTEGGPYVQPLKAAYKQGAVTVMAGLTVPDQEMWLTLAGQNTDNNGAPGVLDVYRLRLDPAQVVEYLTSEYNDFTLTGSALLDSTKLPNAVGGQIYSFALPADHE